MDKVKIKMRSSLIPTTRYDTGFVWFEWYRIKAWVCGWQIAEYTIDDTGGRRVSDNAGQRAKKGG